MQSKEQLIAENAKLKQELMECRDQDRDIREEMTKVLNDNRSSYNSNNKVLSWLELFAKIGELKAGKDNAEKFIVNGDFLQRATLERLIPSINRDDDKGLSL